MAILDSNELLFTAFEPKLQNRFTLGLADLKVQGWMVKSISAPSYTDQEVVIHHINTYRKTRGKREWNDMTMVLYDSINPAASEAVIDWARRSYESVTGRAGYSDFYKKDLELNVLGPVGDIVSQWIIVGAFAKEVNFGEYNYENSDPVEISLTVAMDYCVLNY